MTRWKASALHLCISTLVILTLGTALSLTWYPPTYAWAMGGLGLIAILAGVDITLGPLLTLIVWNVKKPSLRFDMAVIVALQLAGLSYGLYTITQARPVYVVFAYDRFDLVSAADLPEAALEKASLAEFKTLPLTGPKIIAAQRPAEREARNQLLFTALAGGADLAQTPQYYVPYQELTGEILQKAKPLTTLMRRNTQGREKLERFLTSHKLDQAKVKFLPLRAKAHDQTVLLDAATGEILEIMNLDPW